ncbi:MAG TPA: (2Fe-2S)-binding protein [Gaiellaceae bacterium]|nr:(2Fe-2S)-binding protein [Gaiellaceae bacterium]
MATVSIVVNGRRHRVQATPDTPLLYVLRNELGLHAPRFGCGLAQCGACTVHLNGEPVRSCIVPVSAVRGQRVTTLEALATGKSTHPVVQAFIAEDAAQCGYCINGMIMQSIAFLRRNPRPTEAEIKKALNKNICRCGTHYRIVRAVQRAAKAMA